MHDGWGGMDPFFPRGHNPVGQQQEQIHKEEAMLFPEVVSFLTYMY